MNSSKSTVPDPSLSISSIMPSKSDGVSLSSSAAKISLRTLVEMLPSPFLSYSLNASFNSCCKASASSSSKNFDAMAQKPSKFNVPSSSPYSDNISLSSSGSKSCPMEINKVSILDPSMYPVLPVSNVANALRNISNCCSSNNSESAMF